MGDALKKVRAGDRFHIPAQTYNAFIDAAVDYRRRTQSIGGATGSSHRQADIVLVRNESGGALARGSILGIDGPVIAPADNESEFINRTSLSCVVPVAGTHEGRFVVLVEPLADGAMGLAYVFGVCPVKVNVEDAEAEDYLHAEIADGVTDRLRVSPTGSATILWKESGTGPKWALVRIGGGAAGGVAWAKAHGNWHNHSGNGSFVNCYRCADAEGANPQTGSSICVYLPRVGGSDPNVEHDQVIGYTTAADGTYVAVTGYLDAVIGTVRMWTVNSADPPPGWRDCDTWLGSIDMRGRFPVGKGDGDTVGDHGGSTEHCHVLQRNAYPTPPCGYTQIDEGTWQSIYLSTNVADHRPPYCVLRFIERYDNSI